MAASAVVAAKETAAAGEDYGQTHKCKVFVMQEGKMTEDMVLVVGIVDMPYVDREFIAMTFLNELGHVLQQREKSDPTFHVIAKTCAVCNQQLHPDSEVVLFGENIGSKRQHRLALIRVCKYKNGCSKIAQAEIDKHVGKEGVAHHGKKDVVKWRRCAGPDCGKEDMGTDPANKFQACGRCRATYYCSRVCQKAHWFIHKPDCAVFRENV